MQDQHTKKLIVIGAILFLFSGATIAILLSKDGSVVEDTQQGTQQTVTPNPVAAKVYNGISSFEARGLSSSQIIVLQAALDKFFITNSASAKSIQLSDLEHSMSDDPSSLTQIMFFTLKADSTTYSARLEYFGISNARLYVYDQANGLVFDSQSTDDELGPSKGTDGSTIHD